MPAFLQKEFIEAGFDAKEIFEDILLVENFISKDEIHTIFDIINSVDDDEWKKEYLGNLKNFCLLKFGRDDVENLVAEGKFEITQNWEDKNLNILETKIHKVIYNRIQSLIEKTNDDLHLSGFATIQRMQHGVELKSHTDQNTDPSIQYATILYLNDDYKDGELFFKNKNIELKPKSGSLLIFKGTSDFEHGVKIVGDGPIRYVLVGFIKINNFYNKNKY